MESSHTWLEPNSGPCTNSSFRGFPGTASLLVLLLLSVPPSLFPRKDRRKGRFPCSRISRGCATFLPPLIPAAPAETSGSGAAPSGLFRTPFPVPGHPPSGQRRPAGRRKSPGRCWLSRQRRSRKDVAATPPRLPPPPCLPACLPGCRLSGGGGEMGRIEWAMWANEQALASGLSESRGGQTEAGGEEGRGRRFSLPSPLCLSPWSFLSLSPPPPFFCYSLYLWLQSFQKFSLPPPPPTSAFPWGERWLGGGV